MNIVNIVEFIWCASAFGLTAMVLLHSPKGDGIGGIGGQAQLFSSTKSAESNLNRITWGLFIVFMTMTVVLSAGWLPSASMSNAPIVPVAPVPAAPISVPPAAK
jgi:preprotein translocase subunit SecG